MSTARTILHADCLEAMRSMPDASFTAVVCDPPYGIEFMGKAFDTFSGHGLDVGFCHWFAGFTDGEGCFAVHKKNVNGYETYDCQFSIGLRADDLPILERIHRELGIGTIARESRPSSEDGSAQSRFCVSSKRDCLVLRDLFRAFPLRAKKATDFEIWSEALDAWIGHERGEWDAMSTTRDRLMANRKFKPEGVRVDPFQFWSYRWAKEAFRVVKPGGVLLAFGGTRTFHRLTCSIEDAGWEVRDCLAWMYGQGFPKAKSCLKPAWEPIVLASKGTPSLNIDGCRIGWASDADRESQARLAGFKGVEGKPSNALQGGVDGSLNVVSEENLKGNDRGRWPANVVLDEEAAAVLDEQSGTRKSGKMRAGTARANRDGFSGPMPSATGAETIGDSGGASRFFYCAKASKKDRGQWLVEPGIVWYAESSWVREVLNHLLPVATVQSPLRGTDESTTQNKDVSGWSTCWCGSPCTDPFHPDIIFTIETKRSWITVRKISNSSRRSHTRGCMAAVLYEVASGGSLAPSAFDTSPWEPVTGTSVEKDGRSTVDAVLVTSVESWLRSGQGERNGQRIRHSNRHETVKPLELMRWLVRMVRMPSGTRILDPFAGSGSTGVACVLEGVDHVGIEREAEYVDVARARIAEAEASQEQPR